MISASKMSAVARAATLRSHVPGLRTTYSNAIASSRTLIHKSAYSTTSIPTSPTVLQRQQTSFPTGVQLISPYTALPLTRSFHIATARWQQQQKEKHSEEPKSEKSEEAKSEGGKEEGQKEAPPPPPPHGDKTPWQVFRETLQAEFKASKEWNESTKALASSAQEFAENENIKRARAAYEAASGAATSKTSAALKKTGQAIGKGAAWTWETPVVKGIRKGVSATGAGLEKATRPVRETEAYKNVKEAIDDGSSSRYGGWIEKEERRRQRQLREQKEMMKSGRRSTEPLVEDPK